MRRPFLLASLCATALFSTGLTLGLSGCAGYTPLYAPADQRAIATNRVEIGKVQMTAIQRNVGERRVAQRVSQRLRQDFPLAGADLDVLTVNIGETATELAIQSTATVERVSIRLFGDITLTAPDGKILLRANLSTTAPYNVERTPYSTESGKTFARLTAAQNLAEEISRRLFLYYRQHPEAAAQAPAAPVEAPPNNIPAPYTPPFSSGL